jgi:hypothetical protein
MKIWLYAAAAATVSLMPGAAMADTQSGTYNGFTWTAQSNIIGQNSTGTLGPPPAGMGNPIYLGHDNPAYNGVVQLRMQYATGAFVCSGALMTGGRILTAAHCVSDGFANDVNGRANGLLSTTAYFYSGVGQGSDPLMFGAGGVPNPGVVAVAVSGYNTHHKYTGEVIDQNDISVLTLATAAPLFANRYDIYTASDLTDQTFNVAGYGLRSIAGGSTGYGGGNGAGTGRLREGDNTYDFRLGEFYSDIGGSAEFEYSFLSDFDSGLAGNDAGCIVFGLCHLGVGEREVSIAGGDSGGPGFIGGRIASVNSYGLTFGLGSGDTYCDPPATPGGPPSCLQSSFGEFNGFVPTFIHSSWIAGVPEPSTWAMLILGFGVAGAAMRRKGKVQARYAF